MNDLPGWAFLIDIILNFNTAAYNKGLIIFDRLKYFFDFIILFFSYII